MAWEIIENVKPGSTASRVPSDGVHVSARHLRSRGVGQTRYIKIVIGAAAAKALRCHAETHGFRLLIGNGEHAGKIGLTLDAAGDFSAKRDKAGRYALTINAAAARGLFALNFPAFAEDIVTVPMSGQAPVGTFRASDAMLAADDD